METYLISMGANREPTDWIRKRNLFTPNANKPYNFHLSLYLDCYKIHTFEFI